MSALTLDPHELYEITGYKRPADQSRVFAGMGIPIHRRPDGSLSVCRQHYLDLMRAKAAQSSPEPSLAPIQ